MERGAVEVAIVGAGLAGLSAAVTLARAGVRVTVFEAASDAGGRARTRTAQGFSFNLGPHAVYRAGRGRAILQDLGLTLRGGTPAIGGLAVRGKALFGLPAGPASLVRTRLLSWPDKVAAGRILTALPRLDPARFDEVPVAHWIEEATSRPRVREVLAAYFRVSTYAVDTAHHSAGAALRQLQLAQAGVLYLDGGWQTVVNALRDAAVAAGVVIVGARRVVGVAASGAVEGVLLDDGGHHRAQAVILSCAPREAAALLPSPAGDALVARANAIRPVTAACLDLALTSLPRPERTFALGIDSPLYLSVHSASAALAPPGGAVVHVARYGGVSDGEAASVRADLEGVMDLVQPGWRGLLAFARFLPHLTVSHALVTAAQGGLRGRPGVTMPELPGLYLAGDWVGGEGMLADASLSSAQQATEAVLRHVDTGAARELAATA